MGFIMQNWTKFALGLGALISLALAIKNFAKIKAFLLEVKSELTKVSWSTREELIGSTLVVIVITSIMAVFIGIIDLALSKGVSFILLR